MGKNIISYKTSDGQTTTITWFSITGALPDDTYEFCGGSEPLRIRIYGDRYDTLRGSTATITIAIRDALDKDRMRQVMQYAHFVEVKKGALVMFRGKIIEQLYNEPYDPYPYVIELVATDQLGMLKLQRPILTDFPDPILRDNPRWSVMEILNKLLTDPSVMPDHPTIPTGYTRLFCSPRLFTTTATKGLLMDELHGDMGNFFGDGDTYKTKQEIVDALLKPLQMQLFGFRGAWWLMSWDALWDNGSFAFQQYELNYHAGPRIISQGQQNEGIIDINDCSSPGQVRGSAEVSYLPAWQGVEYSMTFTPQRDLLAVFANNGGNFYKSLTGPPLEFESAGVGGYVNLRNWDAQTLPTKPFPEHTSGGLWFPYVPDESLKVERQVTIPWYTDYLARSFKLSLNAYGENYRSFQLRFKMIYHRPPNSPRYLQTDQDGNISWTDQNTTAEFEINFKDQPRSLELTIPRPQDDGDFGQDATLTLWLYGTKVSFLEFENGVIRGFTLQLVQPKWEGVKYQTSERWNFAQVEPYSSQQPVKWDFSWGMLNYDTDYDNSNYIHRSAPLDGTGREVTYFGLDGITDDDTKRVYLKTLMQTRLINDNSSITRVLTGSYFNDKITPTCLLRDNDGYIYKLMEGTWVDKRGLWESVKMVQQKKITDSGSTNGSFEIQSFDNSFEK